MALLYKLNARFNYITERLEPIARNRGNFNWQENMRETRSHTADQEGFLDDAYWKRQLAQALTEIESLRGFSTIKKLFKAEKINGELHFELHPETNNNRKSAEKDLINNHNEHRINIEDWITSIDQIKQYLTDIRNAAYYNLVPGTDGPLEQRITDNHVFLNDLKEVFQKVLKDLNINPESPSMPPLEDSPATSSSSTPSTDNRGINLDADDNNPDIAPQELFPEEPAPIHTTTAIIDSSATMALQPIFLTRPASPLVGPAGAAPLPPRRQQPGVSNNIALPQQQQQPQQPIIAPAAGIAAGFPGQNNNAPGGGLPAAPVIPPAPVNNRPRQPRNTGLMDNMQVPQNAPNFVPPVVVAPANPAQPPAGAAPLPPRRQPGEVNNNGVAPLHQRLVPPAPRPVTTTTQQRRQPNNVPANNHPVPPVLVSPHSVNNIPRQPHPIGQVPRGNMQATPPHYIVRAAMVGSQTTTVRGAAYMAPESPIERLIRLLRAVVPGSAGISERNKLLLDHKDVIRTGTYQQQQEVGNHINHLTEQAVISSISHREIAVATGRRIMKYKLAR
jgi:hypothetical protein